MSVFSKLRLSKKAAKDHKAAQAQKDKQPEAKAPYRHIPTHAAHDAISGSPSAWKTQDRPKILAINRQRSEMSRTASMISTQSNMASLAESVAGASIASSSRPPLSHLPRNSRNNSYRTSWNDAATMDVRPGPARVQSYQGYIGAYKGNSYGSTTRMRRGHSYHDSGIGPSPLSSAMHSEEVSPVVSSGNSLNSHSSDHLEMATVVRSMRPSQHHQTRSSLSTTSQIPSSSNSSTYKPSHSSRASQASTQKSPVVKPGPMPVAEVPVKKKRFSLLGRKTATVVA